jgi:hypothetical protein
MTLTSRLAKTIGADPVLTQSIRIDVNVHKEPTVTVTRLSSDDEIGRIIQCSTFAGYTLVENDELKRLRKCITLTDEEREAVEYFANFQWTMLKPYTATLRSLLARLS